MSDADKRRAWADFWQEGQASRSGGCLAGATDELGAALAGTWQKLAVSLPRRAQVLDLGTGDGIVLKRMRAKRPDLRLTGVDSAPSLPPSADGILLKAGVAIEDLPFRKESFEAVTSQFGYEYGATAEAAREVARVLKPAGRFQFIVHRLPSPIVAHNRARAAAIRWAATESGYLEKAKSLAAARRMAALPTPPIFREAPGDAARRFVNQSVAAEIMHAILQSLDPRLAPEQSLNSLSALERRTRSELMRIEALAAAARDETGISKLVGELRDSGLGVEEPEAMADRYGQPFAWRLAGARTGANGN